MVSELSAAVFVSADGGTTWTTVVTRTIDGRVAPVPGIPTSTDDGRVHVSVIAGLDASFVLSHPLVLT